MSKNYYLCECGKEFTHPRKFCGHKNHCEIHLKAVGKWDKHLEAEIRRSQTKKLSNDIKRKKIIEQKNTSWIYENHCCEHCGKIMTEKYGSGRFCSSECAHYRCQNEVINNKRRKSLEKTLLKKGLNNLKDNAVCKVCGKKFQLTRSKITKAIIFRKTCSDECLHQYRSQHAYKLKNQNKFNCRGGYREGSVKNYKHGNYKGFYFDSSWELAYIVYNLEHNIEFSRNTQSFEYVYKDKVHKYYPDFIQNDIYVEIKNYCTEQVKAKIDQFPKNLKYKIYYYKDIKYMIDYCKTKYGNNYVDLLDEKV